MKEQWGRAILLATAVFLCVSTRHARNPHTSHLSLRSQRPQAIISQIRVDKAQIEVAFTSNEISDTTQKTSKSDFEKVLAPIGIVTLEVIGGCALGDVGAAAGAFTVGVITSYEHDNIPHDDPYNVGRMAIGAGVGYTIAVPLGIWVAGKIAKQKGSLGWTLIGSVAGGLLGLQVAYSKNEWTPLVVFPLIGGVTAYNLSAP